MNGMLNILAAIEYDGKLSGAAYVVLGAMGLLIVGGLSWCLLRALAAANKNAGEQHADEV